MDLSLQDLNSLVETQNLSVKASEFDLKSEQALEGKLKRSFMPSIGLTGGFEEYQLQPDSSVRRGSAYGFIHSELNLYNRGLDQRAHDLQIQKSSSRSISLEKHVAFEKFKAQELYWEVVGLNQAMIAHEKFQRTLNSLSQKAKKLLASRVATKSDELLIQIALRKHSMEAKMLQLSLDEAKNQLALILGLEDHKKLKLTSHFPQNFKSMATISSDYESSLEVQSVEAELKASEIRQNEVSKWWHPSVNLYGEYGTPAPSDELDINRDSLREFVVGVRFDFDFGRVINYKSLNESYKLQNAALNARVGHTKKLLAGLDHELRHDVEVLAKLIEEGQVMLSLVAERERLLEEEFNRGVAKPSDLFGISQENYDAVKAHIENKVDYLQKTAKLHYLNQK